MINCYNYADLDRNAPNREDQYKKAIPLFQIKDAKFGVLYKYKEAYYSLTCINREYLGDGTCRANKCEMTKIDFIPRNVYDYDDTVGSTIICPVCGYVEEDFWDAGESSDEWQCLECNSILSFEREITVEYTTKLVNFPEIIEIKEEV